MAITYNIYVSNSGSDSSIGTAAAPYLTLGKVNTVLASLFSGDSAYVYLKAGDSFVGNIEALTGSYSDVHILPYDVTPTEMRATIDCTLTPTVPVIYFEDKRRVSVRGLNIIQASGAGCAGSRGIEIVCAALHNGGTPLNDRTLAIVSDCSITGAEYGVRSNNTCLYIHNTSVQYAWVRGISIESDTPVARGNAGVLSATDYFKYQISDINIHKAGMSDGSSGASVNGTDGLGLYIGGFVYSHKSTSTGMFCARISITECYVGIEASLAEASAYGVYHTLKQVFIRSTRSSHGHSILFSAAEDVSSATFTFSDTIVISTGDIASAAVIGAYGQATFGFQTIFHNCTFVADHASSGKFIFKSDANTAAIRAQNCILYTVNSRDAFVHLGAGFGYFAWQGDYNLFAAGVSGSPPESTISKFRVNVTDKTFAEWLAVVINQTDTNSTIVAVANQPFPNASVFYDPIDCRIRSDVSLATTSGHSSGYIPELAYEDFFGYRRLPSVAGMWDKGAIDRYDLTRASSIYLSGGALKINSLVMRGVETVASLAQTCTQGSFPLYSHEISSTITTDVGIRSIGIFGLGGRAGVSGFPVLPHPYNLVSPPPVFQTVTSMPLETPYSYDASVATDVPFDLSNIPGTNDKRRACFTLEQDLTGGQTNKYFAKLSVFLREEYSSYENSILDISTSTVSATSFPVLSSTKLTLRIVYTGVRPLNPLTNTLDYQFNFYGLVNSEIAVQLLGVAIPKAVIDGTGPLFAPGPPRWAGLLFTASPYGTPSVSNMSFSGLSSQLLDAASLLPVHTIAPRLKDFQADMRSSINRISNGGFTRYPRAITPFTAGVSSFAGSTSAQTEAAGKVPVHVTFAVQVGTRLNATSYSVSDYIARVKAILTACMAELNLTSSYHDKVIVTVLGYYGANVASNNPYDDTLGNCRILVPRLSSSFTPQVDDFSPFTPGITPGLSTPIISTAQALTGDRQFSRLNTVLSPARTGIIFNSVSYSEIQARINEIAHVGLGSGPYFAGTVAARCYEAGAVKQSAGGFKQMQGLYKLAFFIADDRGPIPWDVMYSNPSIIGFSRSQNNKTRRSQIVLSGTEFRNSSPTRAGVVFAGSLEGSNALSPAPYSIRESARGWTDMFGMGTLNTPRDAALVNDPYLFSNSVLGLSPTASNPWLGPFALHLEHVAKPSTSSAALPLPYSTAADKIAAATQVGKDLANEIKRWVNVAIAPSSTAAPPILVNPVLRTEASPVAGIVFSVAADENTESPITPWTIFGAAGLVEIEPVDGTTAYPAHDGGRQLRLTFNSTGSIFLKQKLPDVKPLRGRALTISVTYRSFSGRALIDTALVIDGTEVILGSEQAAHLGSGRRASYSTNIPVSAKSVVLVIRVDGEESNSVGVASVSAIVGAVSGGAPFTESDADIAVPSGAVVMITGPSCPPGFVRVPNSSGRLALGMSHDPNLFERRISSFDLTSQEAAAVDVRLVDVVLVLDMGGQLSYYAAINAMITKLIERWSGVSQVRFTIVHSGSNLNTAGFVVHPSLQLLTVPTVAGLSRLNIGLTQAVDQLKAMPSTSRKLIFYTVSERSASYALVSPEFSSIFTAATAGVAEVSSIVLNPSLASINALNFNELVYPSGSLAPPGATYSIWGGPPGTAAIGAFTGTEPDAGRYMAKIISDSTDQQLLVARAATVVGLPDPNTLGGQEFHDHTSEFIEDTSVITAGPSIYDSDGFEPPIADVGSGLEVLTNTTPVVPRRDSAYIKPYPFGQYADKGNPEDEPVVAIGPGHVHNVQTDMKALPPAFEMLFCRRV